MKTKMIGTLAIAGLIAMAVFVGPAAADGPANIAASKTTSHNWETNFSTTNGYVLDKSRTLNHTLFSLDYA